MIDVVNPFTYSSLSLDQEKGLYTGEELYDILESSLQDFGRKHGYNIYGEELENGYRWEAVKLEYWRNLYKLELEVDFDELYSEIQFSDNSRRISPLSETRTRNAPRNDKRNLRKEIKKNLY